MRRIDSSRPLNAKSSDDVRLRTTPSMKTGRSESFRRTVDLAEKFARHERTTVLIQGEPGTGKTSLARFIHQNSPRRERVFHRVDLGTLDDPLSSSDLFGHLSGSFSGATGHRHGHFATADRGTLFLDEIGKASKAIQRRLLHTIEYGEFTSVGSDRPVKVDVRVVAATNVDLPSLVEQGEFIPDLFARLGFFQLLIPPLRERRADIPGLTLETISTRCHMFGYPSDSPPAVHTELMAALHDAAWPGNVRELVSAIDFLMVMADGSPELNLSHCSGALQVLADPSTQSNRVQEAVLAAGSVAAAARKLGVARTTIYRHLADQAKHSEGTN